jgi:hypothetical protein
MSLPEVPMAAGGLTVAAEDTGQPEWADMRSAVDWVRRHPVVLGAIALIAAQLAWKAQFLGHLYFRQDDFHDLDLAVEHRFSWDYLTFIGSGHLIIGLRVIAWMLVRAFGTYNWAAASAITMLFVAAASFAAFRLLRDLFGERPAILIPLTIYVLTPLTLPDIGIWSSAMESVPLQLAIFLAASAHIRYVRTMRPLHIVAAAFWIAFGMIFFEKGLMLPPLLFALTASFLTAETRLLAAALASLKRYWRAWVTYAALMVGYLAILLVALRTSATQPKVPVSGTAVVHFTWELLRDVFVPGALGGPWNWYPVAGRSFAFAAPSHALVALAALVACAVVVVSIRRRPDAWRAWAILAGWVLVADIAPVAIGRLNAVGVRLLAVFGLETRYLADAAPVLAICAGLAFLQALDRNPAVAAKSAVVSHKQTAGQPGFSQYANNALALLVAAFVFGSVWSAQAYENVTSGTPIASYIANATQAVKLVPRGTPVFNVAVSGNMVEGLFRVYALESKVIGDILPGKLRWLANVSGTIDGLRMFGPDGRLYLAKVNGTSSPPLKAGRNCWPDRHGLITVPFVRRASTITGELRIGYFLFARSPTVITVSYGTSAQGLIVKPGLHAGYLGVSGAASGVTINPGAVGRSFCVGGVEAGRLRPDLQYFALPEHLVQPSAVDFRRLRR